MASRKRPPVGHKNCNCRRCLLKQDFDRKRARDFKSEPLAFLEAYCDKLNVWEEGASLIRERLAEIRENQRLTGEQKAVLERAEKELLNQHWMNIPKHPSYDRDLRKLLTAFRAAHPHLK